MPDVPPDLTSADPAELARLVTSLSDEKLAEVMRGGLRDQILDEIFRRMSEHFAPEKARDLDAVVAFRIAGRQDGGFDLFQATIADGACVAGRANGTSEHIPRTTIRADAVPFLRLVTGAVSGLELLMRGKLRVEGDLMFAARVGGLFSIPKA